MDRVALDRLELEDLGGKSVRLIDCVERYALVIFLRHLA